VRKLALLRQSALLIAFNPFAFGYGKWELETRFSLRLCDLSERMRTGVSRFWISLFEIGLLTNKKGR
jgi:hypothetical protein